MRDHIWLVGTLLALLGLGVAVAFKAVIGDSPAMVAALLALFGVLLIAAALFSRSRRSMYPSHGPD